ncbi:MAG: nitronate monooxygenase family protein [Candidatus Eremiobacteraeota bacterium]|nr:nitronate monooxygenase family protein [Candidatus Eremiobacteraeota bacterium]
MNAGLNPLWIGDLKIEVPIIQGGMGVRVSTASLAGAVANAGGAGTIASVGLGYGTKLNETDYMAASRIGLQQEIHGAREITDGVIGVNIMVALSNYEDLARTASKENIDYIVSGAGLPLKLPGFIDNKSIKLIPMASSARAADIIIRTWKKRYNRFPDAIVVEGPLAGGHLGFKYEELENHKADSLEKIVSETLEIVNKYEKENDISIPVIPAGGIFDGKDIAKFFRMGAKGVQIGTRFVTTHECSISDEFKKLYIEAKEEDVVIIKSPVGMPGRVIRTDFIDRVEMGETIPFKCNYRCLRSCDPRKAPYCIAKALFSAVKGDIDESVVFCGSNASKIDKIVSVQELIDELVLEASEKLKNQPES